jgi:hypothetical protein
MERSDGRARSPQTPPFACRATRPSPTHAGHCARTAETLFFSSLLRQVATSVGRRYLGAVSEGRHDALGASPGPLLEELDNAICPSIESTDIPSFGLSKTVGRDGTTQLPLWPEERYRATPVFQITKEMTDIIGTRCVTPCGIWVGVSPGVKGLKSQPLRGGKGCPHPLGVPARLRWRRPNVIWNVE